MKIAKKTTVRRSADWAAKVRKFKPNLNALTDSERRQLLRQALADITAGESAVPNVRRR